jgi:MFS family permease
MRSGLGYRIFALAVLLLANILNYADRSILGALAQPIKQDLHVTDAQLGFLAGTSFVLFNAIVGIAMARVGDRWRRNRLLMFGIGLWSLMTLLSGLAHTYPQLVAARIGVGIGEATIGAVGYAMLADIFPQRQRAVVFSIFICGPFIGLTLSLALGGWLASGWAGHCAAFGACGLKGWQAAFVVFGLPGVLVAALAGLLGEPDPLRRVTGEGRASPFAEGLYELSLILPPFAAVRLWRLGGRSAVVVNLAVAALVVAVGAGLVRLTGNVPQWLAVGVAAYGLFSWCQAQAYRDPELFRLTIGSPGFRATVLGGALIATVHGTMSFWSVPLATRQFGMSFAEAGGLLGAAIGGGSLLGTLLGGVAADRWRRVDPAAPLYIGIICVCAAAVLLSAVLLAPTKGMMVCAVAALMVFLAAWPAGITALTQDLVLPLMRGRTAALYVTTTTLIGGSIGPYTVGRIGDATGSIRTGLTCLYLLLPGAFLLFLFAIRRHPDGYLRRDRLAQARTDEADQAVGAAS